MAVSPVSVCSLALTRLGGQPIASLSEGSKEAILCSAFYELSRDATLRDHPWNFATRRRALAVLASGGTDGDAAIPWAYIYGWPSDCLLARRIHNPGSTTVAIPYEVALNSSGERVIYTDQATATLVYTTRVTDLTLCDPLFIEAMTWKLATELAIPLTQDRGLMQVATTMYQNAIAKARTLDANEGSADDLSQASWLEARLGYQSLY